ncbi:MAG: hypothetical protein GY784_18710, partial [Gammaproteobacteria bacterium]|nr:hypothetical protein [Gammaproteobacteria bacterium]
MKTICKKFNTALGIALLTFSYSYNVLAAPGTLVQSPLFLSNSVEPNIFLTLDDSGSMGWGLMVSSEDAERITNGRAGSGKPRIGGRYRAIYNPDWYWWGHILPPSAGQNNTWAQDIWMMRNHNFNKLYYNPATIYSPWPGVDENNQPLYKDASITKASRHPNQNWAHTDLTTKKDYNGGNGLLEIYLPTYYIWNDDGDGVPENGEEQLVEIQANDAEMANFANWYVYYRTRELSAKAAIGGVVNNAGTARMGLDIFNQGHQVDVRTMTDASNKLALLEAVYDIPAMGGTPARESLKRVGKYFKEAGKNAPILKDGGECQQNFNILMTDGFWNGSSPKLGNADNDNDTNYDGGSYADGSGDTLADVAMWFYEHDLRPDIDNNVPTIPGVDEASHQHLVNYTIAFGLKGTLDPDTKDPTSAGFAWPSPWKDNGAGKIDDLWHAAYNSRGKYLSADNPQELENALNAMIQDISVRTETATSAAVSASLLTAGSKVYLTEFISGNWEGTIDAYGLKEVNHVWTLV